MQTLEERLFDLVWEWGYYASRGIAVGGARLPYLRSTIDRLSRKMFGGEHTPEDLVQFVRALHCERELSAQGFPRQIDVADACEHNVPVAAMSNMAQKLVRDYLRNTEVCERGRALETIAVKRTGPRTGSAAESSGAHFERKWGRRGLTVEVNPSSNLMIGDLGDLDEHPIWRLRPVKPVDQIPSRVGLHWQR